MKNRDILKQVLRTLAGTAVCTAGMLGVYALLHKLTVAVFLGGLAGCLIAVGNFLFLAMTVARAADKAAGTGDAAKAGMEIRSSAVGRLLCVFLIYFVLLRTGKFDPLAALLPLVFQQLSLRVLEFFRKEDHA